jgi:hypothetical protein
MSNKTIFQEKNKRLNANNTNLSSVLNIINNLPEGTTPTGSLDITENGTYDVTNYASANVNVAGSGGSGGLTSIGTLPYEMDGKYNVDFLINSDNEFLVDGAVLSVSIATAENVFTEEVILEYSADMSSMFGTDIFGVAGTNFNLIAFKETFDTPFLVDSINIAVTPTADIAELPQFIILKKL